MQQQEEMKKDLRRLERKVHMLEKEKAAHLWDKDSKDGKVVDAEGKLPPSKVRLLRSQSVQSGYFRPYQSENDEEDDADGSDRDRLARKAHAHAAGLSATHPLDSKSSAKGAADPSTDYRKRSYSESALKLMLHGLSATHHANRLAAKHYDYRTISDQRISPRAVQKRHDDEFGRDRVKVF